MTLSNENGFTVVDLLIAMMLTGIVVSYAFKAYRHFEHSYYKWQQRVEMEEVSRRILSTICADLQSARKIEDAQTDGITISSRDNRNITYTLRNGAIHRNGHILNKGKNLRISLLNFGYFDIENQPIQSYFMQELVPTLREKIGRLTIKLVMEHKSGRRFQLISGVSLRNLREFEYE